MKELASFVLGVVAGWGARSVLDSRRDALVSLTAATYRLLEATRRHAGVEREQIEDLLAEGKAQWEADRRRRAAEAAARAEAAQERASR